MAVPHRAASRLLPFVLVIAAAGTAPPPHAQGGPSNAKGAAHWVLQRTADGHPDFQGVWANNTVTPLQRPKQWEGKQRLTDADIAQLQKVASKITENDGDAQFGDGFILAVLAGIEKPTSYDPAGTGNYNQFWVVERDWHDRRTALIVDPADGHIPPRTPEAEKRRAAEVEYRKVHAFEDPEMFGLGERCVNFGIPRVQAGYNSYVQIVQSPGYVMIMSEMAHDARIIPLDGRPHLDSRIRLWNGDSRGRWEGDTLVIDTTNFSPESDFMGSHENLRLTERLTRVASDILEYEFTVNDPTTWTRPWTAMIPLKLKNELIYEYACHEGNEAMPDTLRGHRFEEREAAATRSQPK
jgi:hypothetical protein